MVLLFCVWNAALAAATNPRNSTPLTTVMTTATTIAVPTNIATSSSMRQRRIIARASSRMASLTNRASPISAAAVMIATGSERR